MDFRSPPERIRRQGAIISRVRIVISREDDMPREEHMAADKPSFVFVHGAWHGAHTWHKVVPLLAAEGYACRAIDLPGAGAHARLPQAFSHRPLDAAAFATEVSPNAGVTQQERTDATIAAVRAAALEGNGRVILVGHSLGGITLSPTAEAVPELIAAAVYVTAFLLPPGMPAIAMIQHETMAAALVPALFAADPQVVGALRIDTMTGDADASGRLKSAFFGDVDAAAYEAFRPSLHCDEPAAVALEPSGVTPERFGSVARHYIRCAEDRAITPEGQDFMVSAMDAALGGTTTVHRLDASHSPFLSMPRALADILLAIAR
jgi:pimeloyl-ACP methyl ester carboxylesterase